MQEITRSNYELIDELELDMFEAAMSEDVPVEFYECPIIHTFAPKMYVREMLVASNKYITSKVHKTTHLFILLQGSISIMNDDGEMQLFHAPFKGITKEGTRRFAYTHTDTVWITFHPLSFIKGDENELQYDEMMKIVDRVEDIILDAYENKLLGGVLTRNEISLTHKIDNK